MSSPASPFPAGLQLKQPVCVFCGSSPGLLPIYANAAKAVGRALAQNNIPLIYGGGRRGLMGMVSAAALEAGGYVHGIIPESLVERASQTGNGLKSGEGQGVDILDNDYDGRFTTEVTQGMHERKLKMANYSTGGFICLPGGYGTFEEMMEMITWNQLGIHSLPVMVLNIGNFYAPIRTLLEGAVTARFIQPQNLALVSIIDIEEEGEGEGWGDLVVNALEDWTPPNAGYGLKWDEKEKQNQNQSRKTDFSLFTTMRYTTNSRKVVEKEDIPLWSYHIVRLREAHEYFVKRDGGDIWGVWPGDEVVWGKVMEKLEQVEIGDYRVRLLLHSGAIIEVQALPAPADAGPFRLDIPETKGKTRPLVLDPEVTDITSETAEKKDFRLYKTTNRTIYDKASARAPNNEILLHTSNHLLETATSNIAIQSISGEWITPRLDKEKTPFLDGVMRRYLLEKGSIRDGEMTIHDLELAKVEGRRVVGFNGLRGVWEAELV